MARRSISFIVSSIVACLGLNVACSRGSGEDSSDVSAKLPEALIERKGDISIWSISKLRSSSPSREAFLRLAPKGASSAIDMLQETINIDGVKYVLIEEDRGWKLVYSRDSGTRIITPAGDHVVKFEKRYYPLRILVNPNSPGECYIGTGYETDASAVTGLYRLKLTQRTPVPIKKFTDGSFGSLYYDEKLKMVVMVGVDYKRMRGFYLKQDGSITYMPKANMGADHVGAKGTYGAIWGKGYHIPGLFDARYRFVAYRDMAVLKGFGLNLKNVDIEAVSSEDGSDTVLFGSRSKKVADPFGVYVVWTNR